MSAERWRSGYLQSAHEATALLLLLLAHSRLAGPPLVCATTSAPQVVLFSKAEEPTPLYRALSCFFKPFKMDFALASADDAELMKAFGVAGKVRLGGWGGWGRSLPPLRRAAAAGLGLFDPAVPAAGALPAHCLPGQASGEQGCWRQRGR